MSFAILQFGLEMNELELVDIPLQPYSVQQYFTIELEGEGFCIFSFYLCKAVHCVKKGHGLEISSWEIHFYLVSPIPSGC